MKLNHNQENCLILIVAGALLCIFLVLVGII